MKDTIKTREMESGPARVPVMVKKSVANDLAAYLLEQGQAKYDTAMERIIQLGIEAARRERVC
jgi:hypothetical protein